MRSIGRSKFSRVVCQLSRAAIFGAAIKIGPDDLERSAMVFAPHADDEILGCGGLILKKKQSGAELKLVFMTDGGNSHNHLVSRKELVASRRQEALIAGERLGLETRDIFFMDYPDGRLDSFQKSASDEIVRLLSVHQPQDVFIPYSRDDQGDHIATHSIVHHAVREYSRYLAVYEYPVWFWNNLPWTPIEFGSRSQAPGVLSQAAQHNFYALRDFNSALFIGDVLQEKKQALAAHDTQMRRQYGCADWLTLADVADGLWLQCFFQEYEVFHRSVVHNAARAHAGGELKKRERSYMWLLT